MKIYLLTIATAILFLTSCKSPKQNLSYFENIKDSQEGVLSNTNYEIKIVPDDELFISVSSLIPEATAAYNLPLSNPAMRSNLIAASQPKQQTYTVDVDGNINFPIFGKIHVEGLTTKEIAELLEEKISKEVDKPTVKVELVNFKVNVIGEVKKPQTVYVGCQRFSILDALSSCGDLTEFGLRENVLLIREEGNTKTYHRLNLNDESILESPYYYLKQNDVVYVEPNKIKKDNSKYNQNNAFKVSVVSTIVSAISVIASLVIALTVK